MNPVELSETIKKLLQWDIDRLASLLAGMIIGGFVVWWLMARRTRGGDGNIGGSGGRRSTAARTVFWQGNAYHLCRYGPQTSRIQVPDGRQQSRTVPTHELFGDAAGTVPVTRDWAVGGSYGG
jgi:hypothetical protein